MIPSFRLSTEPVPVSGPASPTTALLGLVGTVACLLSPSVAGAQSAITPPDDIFRTSDRCIACHKGVTDRNGLDVSIGFDWRASMMANSARDPYFLAALSREMADHPEFADEIEAECATCHAPMSRRVALAKAGLAWQGGEPEAATTGQTAHVGPVGLLDAQRDPLVEDGVSCAVCHQILPDGLGAESTFSGQFALADHAPVEGRAIFGPFAPDDGGAGIMHSATGFRPKEGPHVQKAGLCASCHTLTTRRITADGSRGAGFLEQAPYLEWLASSYAEENGKTCQDCHMPEVSGDVPVTRVLGTNRPEVSRHVFRGGNFFMLRMLNRYREELGVTALPQELVLAAERTEAHLRSATARISIESATLSEGRLVADVLVENLAGHKFPTAYPSRRAWLRFTVAATEDRVIFESGGLRPDGMVVGDDHDTDPSSFEPHHTEITSPGQVQVYQAVMGNIGGEPTTALLQADDWLKDNRLLPRGFASDRADDRVAVRGRGSTDADFVPGSDEVRYSVPVDPPDGPLTVSVELLFQPIGYRWAENLAGYDTDETERFVRYYRDMAHASAIVIAKAVVEVS